MHMHIAMLLSKGVYIVFEKQHIVKWIACTHIWMVYSLLSCYVYNALCLKWISICAAEKHQYAILRNVNKHAMHICHIRTCRSIMWYVFKLYMQQKVAHFCTTHHTASCTEFLSVNIYFCQYSSWATKVAHPGVIHFIRSGKYEKGRNHGQWNILIVIYISIRASSYHCAYSITINS